MKGIVSSLKASSLANAIFLCLMISIFCGCLVLISGYQDLLNDKLHLQAELLHNNNAAFNHSLGTLEAISFDAVEEIDVLEDGIVSQVLRKRWGYHEVLVVTTAFKKDTVTKAALIGKRTTNERNLALYLTDYDKPLRLSGKTRIIGDIKIPKGKLDQAYLNGNEGNSLKINSRKMKSSKRLPRISSFSYGNIANQGSKLMLPDLNSVNINEFSNETVIVRVDELKDGETLTLKGNYILISDYPLEIPKSYILNDVLIMAPDVKFKSGFRGNVHVIANTGIELEENVSLEYPSSIYVKNDYMPVVVEIGEDSSVLGGIIITGDTYVGATKRELTINEGALVMGNIYCYGKTQLSGQILGSLFTDRFFLETETSSHENVILNGVIDSRGLPSEFVGLPILINQYDEYKYEVIKEF